MMTLPCYYLAPVSYYSALCHADEGVAIDVAEFYQKQTFRNRCVIDSPQGALALTIPVVKPEGKMQMKDIRISDHGNWRHQHWNALQSSYRQSPFFEYYADDFAPFYERKWEFLADYNLALHQLVCELIDIEHKTSPSATPTYYQVFAHKHGFLPDLSIVDLLFNMGPESLLLL